MERIQILGVQIDNVSKQETLERIRQMILSRQPHQIVTPAIEQVICARHDPEFNQVLQDADLVVPDGMQVVFASRLYKTPLRERITGVDLVPQICRLAAQEKFSVFFMGGEPGVAEETAQRMQTLNPGLTVAGTYFPPFGFLNDPAAEQKAIQSVRAAKPDILFLALGAPKQEKWIHRRKADLGVPVMIGVGGAFNFLSGHEKRAPAWVQNLGLEGFYRLFQRPRELWKRVLVNAPFFFLLLLDRLSYHKQKQIALWFRPIFLGLADMVLTPGTFLFSYWLYFRSGIFSNAADPFADVPSLLAMPAYSDLLRFVAPLSLPVFWLQRLYTRDKYQTLPELLRRTLQAAFTLVFLLICFQYLFSDIFQVSHFKGFSRMVFAFFGISLFCFLSVWRIIFLTVEQFLHRRGINMDRIIIVGTGAIVQRMMETIKKRPELGLLPLGYVTLSPQNFHESEKVQPNQFVSMVPFLGTLTDLQSLLPDRKVDEVLIGDPDLPLSALQEIVRLCRKYKAALSIIPSLHELLGVSSEIKRLGDFRVITVKPDRYLDDWLAKNLENAE